MKKKVYLFSIFALFIIGISFYFVLNGEAASFSSPEEAIHNAENNDLPVKRIIVTEYFEAEKVAYTFFYSPLADSEDYLGVAQSIKTKEGWQFKESRGVMGIIPTNADGSHSQSQGNRGNVTGLAPVQAQAVYAGETQARLIPLEGKALKIWLFHDVVFSDFEKKKLSFIDNEGNNLLNN